MVGEVGEVGGRPGKERALAAGLGGGDFSRPPSPNGLGFAASSGGFIFSPCKRILPGLAPRGRCEVVGEVSPARVLRPLKPPMGGRDTNIYQQARP